MNRYELIAAAALLVMVTRADAGSFNPAIEDPVVQPPECVWFGFIPCHTGFDYEEPEGDAPRVSDAPRQVAQRPEPQPEPEEVKCQ